MSLITEIILMDTYEKMHINLHDFLSDEADWNDEFWIFEKSKLAHISNELNKIFNYSKNGITFTSIWSGDYIKSEQEVSIKQFIDIIKNNKIGTHIKYIIR
ncbi:MAG: hypothetical protein ACNI25_08580 [Halarcobacter sp.]